MKLELGNVSLVPVVMLDVEQRDASVTGPDDVAIRVEHFLFRERAERSLILEFGRARTGFRRSADLQRTGALIPVSRRKPQDFMLLSIDGLGSIGCEVWGEQLYHTAEVARNVAPCCPTCCSAATMIRAMRAAGRT